MNAPAARRAADWWRDAVIYQIYPRSFADSDGDGTGDLPGATARLDHLAALGVDAVWLSPFYRSPLHDAGYDVSDYRDVDPRFGTMADVDALLDRAAELGLAVIVDLVPNHTSSEHPWFQAALAAAPGSPERARYLFRDGRGPGGDAPPNDWRSGFGGPGWTRVTEADGRPGQWYLHLFDVTQPDLDWTCPDVPAEFAAILRWWLDKGVAGFRVDVAHGLVKAAGLPDLPHPPAALHEMPTRITPFWDQDGVHDIYVAWRRILDGYGTPERILCAEAWVTPPERMARYVRPDEMHQAFTFDVLKSPWNAQRLREVIDGCLESMASVGAPCTWVLSNHDVVRHATRLGLPDARESARLGGLRATDPQPNRALGLRRARAATTLMLALPGAAYLYQGEELGLPDHTSLPDALRDDPVWRRSGGSEAGRDGARIPMPWAAAAPGFGFSPTGRTWLPQPAHYRGYAVDAQTGVADSTLELYRTLLRLRREHRLGRGSVRWLSDGTDAPVLALANGSVEVHVNLGDQPVPLPDAAEVLVTSATRPDPGWLPPDAAVWLRR